MKPRLHAWLTIGSYCLTAGLGVVVLSAVGWFLWQGTLGSGVLGSTEHSSMFAMRTFFDRPALGRSVLLSLWVGIASSLMALWITRHLLAGGGRFGRLVTRFLAPVLAIPHVAFAIGISLLIWPGGWFARLLSPWFTGWQRVPDWVIIGDPFGLTLIFGLVLREVPFLVMMALVASRGLNVNSSMRAGQSLGLTSIESWHRLVWPQLWPRLRLPFVLVLAYGLTNVEMTMVLGPNMPPSLSVLVLQLFYDPNPQQFVQLPWAALCLGALTLAVIAGTLAILECSERGEARRAWSGSWSPLQRFFSALASVFAQGIGWLIFGVFAFGLVASILFALSRQWRFPDAFPELSMQTIAQLGASLNNALGTTLFVAIVSAGFSLLLLVFVLEYLARRGRRDWPKIWQCGLYAPLILPQIVVVLSLYAAVLPLGFEVGTALTVFGHSLFIFCFSALLLGSSWLQFDPALIRQAESLGLSPMTTLTKIKIPMLAGPLLLTFVLSLTVSFSLYLPTLVFGGGRVTTLLTEGVHFATNLRRPQMAVFATAQTLLSMIGLAICFGVLRLLDRKRQGIML